MAVIRWRQSSLFLSLGILHTCSSCCRSCCLVDGVQATVPCIAHILSYACVVFWRRALLQACGHIACQALGADAANACLAGGVQVQGSMTFQWLAESDNQVGNHSDIVQSKPALHCYKRPTMPDGASLLCSVLWHTGGHALTLWDVLR